MERPGRARNRVAGTLVALVVGVLAGCAKREPPSGGPPDLEPPRRTQSTPDSGAAAVPVATTLSVTFSEPMEPRSTADAVSLAPRVEIKKRQWSGRTLRLVLDQPLEPNHTYTLYVGGTARDRHNNALGTGSTVVFSTADTFPAGRIAGEIEAHGLSDAGVALWCYRDGHEPDSTARDFDAIGISDGDGRFRIDGLAVPGSYRLWAFADQNNNRSLEPLTDIFTAVDTVFHLTPQQPVANDVRIGIVNPRAPGTVKGAVLDSLPDSLGVRVVAVSERDSMRRVTEDVDAEGHFEIELEPGSWWIRLYRDLDRSKSWEPSLEPAGPAVLVVVAPAAEGVEVKLRRPPPPGGK